MDEQAGLTVATALEYLHACAEDLGEFGTFTTTSAATDTDYLVSTSFVNSNFSATDLEGASILIESGALLGQQVAVKSSAGIVKTTGVVNFAEDGGGNVANAVTFGVYGRFPAFRRGSRPGYLQLISRALARIPQEDRITFAGVTGQYSYPVSSAYNWWTDTDCIIAVYHPAQSAGDVPRQYTGAVDMEIDGEMKSLVFSGAPWKTGDIFTVKVYRPGNSRLKVFGVWADQTSETAGLSNLTDEALCSVSDVRTVTKAYAYRALAELHAPGQTVGEWMAMADLWEQRAVRLLHGRPKRDRLTGIPNMRPGRSYARRYR